MPANLQSFPSILKVAYILMVRIKKLFYAAYKMERLKVVELKASSKSLGLRGYSRLRKADLVKLIQDHLASRPRPVPRPQQVMKPPKDVIRERPSKPMRPPLPPPKPIPPPRPPCREPPIPPPRPPQPPLQRYQLREKDLS